MSGAIPDVVSLYVEEAAQILQFEGIEVKKIIVTRPPSIDDERGAEAERYRVVTVSGVDGGGVALVVTPAFDIERFFARPSV